MIRKIFFIIAMMIPVSSCSSSVPPASGEDVNNKPVIYEIGVSLNQGEENLKRSIEIIARVLFELAKPGDEINITDTDSGALEQITTFSYPIDMNLSNQQLKQKYFGGQLNSLLLYFKNHQSENDDGDLNIPAFARHLASKKQEYANRKINVLLIGSPIFHSSDDLYGGMAEGFLPDAVLSLHDSPFNIAKKEDRLSGLDIHLIWNRNDFKNDYHLEMTERFWNLYFTLQGARLLTFTGNSKAYSRLNNMNIAQKHFETNPNDTKLAIHTVERVPSNIFGKRIAHNPPPPRSPISENGIEIGAVWEGGPDQDVDMYVKFEKGSELFYKVRSALDGDFSARFFKDRDTGYELIKTVKTAKIDLRKITVYLNYYAGKSKSGMKVQVRVRFNNNLYSMPFAINASRGDKGQSKRNVSTWIKVDLEQIVGLM